MRLIDADALMKTLGITDMDCGKCAWRDKEWNLCNRGSDFEDACCAIENAPTIEERKTGEWISLDDYRGKYNDYGYKCSECGEHSDYEASFCPNCGSYNGGNGDGDE